MDSKDAAQNPAAENDAAELAEHKNRLRSRRCQYCNKLIKHYIFSSITIPFEHVAQSATKNMDDVQSMFPFYTWGHNAFQMFCRILLVSTCSCGNVSFWECGSRDIDALISQDMTDDGYFIELVYEKNTIKDMYTKTSDEKFKKSLEDVLKLFPEDKGE